MIRRFGLFLWFGFSLVCLHQTAKPLEAAPIRRYLLLRGGTLWTATGAILKDHDLLVRDGKIAAIGRHLSANGAMVLDVRGKHLTPGLIDTHSHIGVYPIPWASAHADGNEMVKAITAYASAEHAFWPQDPAIPRAVEGGTTTAQILPGSANLIGGRSLIVRLRLKRTVQEMRFPLAPYGIKMACGENPKRVHRNQTRTRMGNIALMRMAFQQAREYKQRWDDYQRDLARWNKKHATKATSATPTSVADAPKAPADPPKPPKAPADPPKAPQAPTRDLNLEVLQGVIEGKHLVHIHCYRADEMRWMIALAGEFGFRIRSFHHAIEAYKIRDILAKEQIAASVWADWWGFKMEAFDTIEENAPLIAAAGGRAIIHSDSSVGIQRLNQEAAKAYYRGLAMGLKLSEDEAIRWVTRNPAWALGIDAYVGTLEVGKYADITIWDGHPLRVYTRTSKVLINGEIVYDRQKPRPMTDFEIGLTDDTAIYPPTTPPHTSPTPLTSSPPPLTSSPIPSDGLLRTQKPVSVETSVRSASHAQTEASTKTPCVMIRQAMLHTMLTPASRGDVVWRGKQIVAVGPNLSSYADSCKVIQGSDYLVTPGFAVAQTGLGLTEVMAESNTQNDKMISPLDIKPAFQVSDGFHPRSVTLPVARLSGITQAEIAPVNGLVSGQSALISLGGRQGPHVYDTPLALHAGFGSGWRGSTAHAWLKLREALDDARFYHANKAAYNLGKIRPLSLPRIHLEALGLVLRRQIPLVLSLHRAEEIRRAIRFAKAQRIRLVLSGVAEGWRVANDLAKARIPVLLGSANNLPQSFDTLHSRFENAALLAKAGVLFAFTPPERAHFVRNTLQEVGIMVAHGLPHATALAGLSRHFFEIFGIRDYGVLRANAYANIVLWKNDPLELSSRPVRIWIHGQPVPLHSRQTLLRDRYRTLPLP